MMHRMGERNPKEPDQGYQPREDPDTEPPRETVEADSERDRAEGRMTRGSTGTAQQRINRTALWQSSR
jgi:hypothetical protein